MKAESQRPIEPENPGIPKLHPGGKFFRKAIRGTTLAPAKSTTPPFHLLATPPEKTSSDDDDDVLADRRGQLHFGLILMVAFQLYMLLLSGLIWNTLPCP